MKNLLLVLLVCIAFCACENDRDQSAAARTPDEDTTTQVDSDTITAKDIAEMQLRYVALKGSIRDNKSRIDSMDTNLATLKKELDNKANSITVYIFLIISVLSIILVISSLIAIRKLNSSKKKIKNTLGYLEKSVKELKESVNCQMVKPISRDYREDIDSLYRQIEKINCTMDRNNLDKIKGTDSPKIQAHVTSSDNHVKVGYLGVNNDKGFIGKSYLSATEEAVFKYYSNSENHIEFEPISLKRIKSITSICKAVEILEGSLQDATSMEIIKCGQAVCKEQNGKKFWEILKPAEIKLK